MSAKRGRFGEAWIDAAVVIKSAHFGWWAVSGRDCLAASGPHAEHLLWWPQPDGDGLATKIVSEVALNFDVPSVTVLFDGKKPPDESLGRALTAHPGFRFFRLAQRTNDLLDACASAGIQHADAANTANAHPAVSIIIVVMMLFCSAELVGVVRRVSPT
jgi:hypothetical protein